MSQEASTVGTLRRKLPEILIEGLFVVFAILLALAADEWREDKQKAEIAERALQGIEAEMKANRVELESSRGPNLEVLERLVAEVEDGEPARSMNVQFEYALLSSAAWRTAQVTQATHYVDYNLIQQIAKLYDVQELFAESQRGMVEQLTGLSGEPDRFAQGALGRLRIVMGVEAGYSAVLDTMIVQMESR